MKLCHTCNDGNMSFSKICDPREAAWIKREKLEPVPINLLPKECKIQFPENSDIELIITQDKIKSGKKILYWAAYGKSIGKSNEIEKAVDAYKRKGKHKFKNFGCTRVRKDGKILLKIESPQCYKEKNKLWPKHLHFIEENEDNTWKKENFYTVSGLPLDTEELKSRKLRSGNVYVSPEQVKRNWKKRKFYMVYALSDKFPSLINIDRYKDYNHIQIDHESDNIKLPSKINFSTPMVVYCAKKSCNASKKLLLKLSENGYENLFYMEEGMTEFSLQSLDLLQNYIDEKKINDYSKMIKI